jgi:hypothetical protein
MFALSALVSTAPALAQTPNAGPLSAPARYAPLWYAPPGTVPVAFSSDVSPTRFSLERVEDHRAIGRCTTACITALYPGRYLLRVTPSAKNASGKKALLVDRPMQVRISPDAPWQRPLGLAMGIIGILPMLIGGAVILRAASCEKDDCGSSSSAAPVGGMLFAGGATLTVGGWVMFGQSFKPEIETRSW